MAKATAELFKNRIVGYDTKPADQFTANPLNYRKHPQRQRDAVNASLRELGWISTVVENVTTGNVIDGHERIWQALQRNEDVPYLKVELSEAEERLALAVFDPITNMAETDAAILDDLLREVNTGEAALQALLAELADGAGLYGEKTTGDTPAEVDRAEELRQKWGVAAGQLWQLGEHRLICGDCTDPATVARVMGGERASLAWFDPPFGIDLVPQRGLTERIANDGNADARALWAAFLPLLKANMSPDTNVFLCQDWTEFEWTLPLVRQYFTVKSKIVWNKNVWGIGYYTRPKHEDILYCWNGEPSKPVDAVADVWDVAREAAPDHAAEKPPELSGVAISHFSAKGDVVIDWFNGVGGSIIACENLARRCRAVEISPAYVAVALERWSVHTGKTPVLIG